MSIVWRLGSAVRASSAKDLRVKLRSASDFDQAELKALHLSTFPSWRAPAHCPIAFTSTPSTRQGAPSALGRATIWPTARSFCSAVSRATDR
jgi:hypothetical protein